MAKIKNIVFDVGNVLVKWYPVTAVAQVFPEHPNVEQLTASIFKSTIWYDLNLGKITEIEALHRYHETLGIALNDLMQLVEAVKISLLPIEQGIEILNKLYQGPYALYALTDNTHEIVAYLKTQYDFWDKFKGIVVSAEVGYLKPAPEIYHFLLNTYGLQPEETVFMDDYLPNIEGAIKVGIHGIRFKKANRCIEELKKLGVKI